MSDQSPPDQPPAFPSPSFPSQPQPMSQPMPQPASQPMPPIAPPMPPIAPPMPPTIEWSAPGMPLPAAGYPAMPPGPMPIPLADSGLRFAARFLDRLIMWFITCIPAAGITGGSAMMIGVRSGSGQFSRLGAQLASALISAVIVLLYDGVATGVLGGTLMKRAFGMRVVNQSDGQPVSMQVALLRAAPLAICTAVPILGSIGMFVMGVASLIFLFTDKLRQTVSDKVAKTVVIKAN